AQQKGDKYREAVSPPILSEDGRTLVHLIAPGADIQVPEYTPDGNGKYVVGAGSSFAVPHATGTVALLQEAAKDLGQDAKRHEVMKAVLINSAEKIEGRLGMG